MEIAVRALNRPLYALRERTAFWDNIRKVARKMVDGVDPLAVQNWIDETVEKNTHRFRTTAFKIEVRDPQRGRVSFDLKSGTLSESVPGVKSCRSLF